MTGERTKGWAAVGLALIIAAGAAYVILGVLGVGVAVTEASRDSGAPLYLVLLLPGMAALGFAILLAKVIVDRLNSPEDDYYSKHIDQ